MIGYPAHDLLIAGRQHREASAPSPRTNREIDGGHRRGIRSGLGVQAARTIGTVAGLAVRARTCRAAQLAAASNFLGHPLHLLFSRQPARACPDVPTSGVGRPEQPEIQGLKFSLQRLQLGYAPLGLGEFVRHHVPHAIALFGDLSCWARDQLAHLAQGKPESLGALDELDPAHGPGRVDAIARLGPVRRIEQAGLLGSNAGPTSRAPLPSRARRFASRSPLSARYTFKFA